MTIKIKITTREEKFNVNHRKTNLCGLDRVIKIFSKDFEELVDCRVYFSTSFNTCYCCLWISCGDKNIYKQGSGTATGSGYDKGSAAIAEAIFNAGIDVSEHFAGGGYARATEVLKNIAKKVSGRRKVFVINSVC